MPKTSDKRRHWLLLPAWPERDRAGWLAATAPCHPLEIPSYGQKLTPASLASVERAYGRYLNFLDWTGELDSDQAPAERVTPVQLAAYARHLADLKYRGQTPVLLFSGLVSAMRILAPDMDVRWIWRPNGTSISERLRGPRKTFDVPKASDMFAWGHTLMAHSDVLPEGRVKLAEMRDGLMIGILACRPLRRRTMWELRLGEHLVRTENGWRLILKPENMKNRRPVEFDLPASLSPRIEQYVTDVRKRAINGT